MRLINKSKLPRLTAEWYVGPAMVFWSHSLEDRATGWLSDGLHARFREILLHASARESLICPTYVLMPDHLHLVWLGLAAASDQSRATKFLRGMLKPLLAPAQFQDRGHDHVLRGEERTRGAFMSVT